MSKRNRSLTHEEVSRRLSGEDQRNRYLNATRKATWRNRGPKGSQFGPRPWRAEYEILLDVVPVDGSPGYTVSLCKHVNHSRKRAKQALQQVQRRNPTARYVKHYYVVTKSLQS